MVNFKIVLFETVALPRTGFSLGPKSAHSAALFGPRKEFFLKTAKCFAENYSHNFFHSTLTRYLIAACAFDVSRKLSTMFDIALVVIGSMRLNYCLATICSTRSNFSSLAPALAASISTETFPQAQYSLPEGLDGRMLQQLLHW